MLAGLACAASVQAADLTPVESRWLQAGMPVLAHAQRALNLPVDVVVQPQDTPGQAPLAMGYVDGRCKLVLSMRGNPLALSALADAPPALQPIVIEAMTAHEMAHCWRHASGQWKVLPAGFVQAQAAEDSLEQDLEAMRATRREEGFADLAGLAWVLRRHPHQYAAVYGWFERVREHQPVPGAHHDTRAWLRTAREGSAFPQADGIFEQAQALWAQHLESAERKP
jgi:hypothetical protein